MPREPAYTVDHSSFPPSCLPTWLLNSGEELIDVTKLSDAWRCYVEVRTGKLHDGSKYAAETIGTDAATGDVYAELDEPAERLLVQAVGAPLRVVAGARNTSRRRVILPRRR